MKARRPRCAAVALYGWGLLIGLVFEGCRFLESEPPFEYLSAQLLTGEEPGCHRLVGLHYSLRNAGERTITAVRASFDLYDASGSQLPGPGRNHFDLGFDGVIAPHSTWSICSSLDSSFYFQPTVELVADRFRVYRVEFSDGSTWSDPFALYGYPYPVTSSEEEATPGTAR